MIYFGVGFNEARPIPFKAEHSISYVQVMSPFVLFLRMVWDRVPGTLAIKWFIMLTWMMDEWNGDLAEW
jgi:hypothetical protein